LTYTKAPIDPVIRKATTAAVTARCLLIHRCAIWKAVGGGKRLGGGGGRDNGEFAGIHSRN